MSPLEHTLKQLIRETLVEILGDGTAQHEPDLISIEQVCELADCDDKTIRDLIKDADRNGFPAIWFGTRTVRIDKARLMAWMAAGGLQKYGQHHQGRQAEVQGPGLKAVPRAA